MDIINSLLIDNQHTPFQSPELQNTYNWYLNRWGKITSSKLSAICAPKGLGAIGINYLNSLLYERYQKIPSAMHIENMEKDISWEVKQGKQYEPIAREKLSLKLGYDIDYVPFIDYTGFEKQAGDSSDGSFNYKGHIVPIELKCTTNSSTTIKRCKMITKSHQDFWQCQGHILAYNAPFMIYAVFDASSNFDPITYQVVLPSEQDFLKDRINMSIDLLKNATNNNLMSIDDNIIDYNALKMFPF